MATTDELMAQAWRAAVADKIMEAMDGERRDAILRAGVADALKDYNFRQAVEKLVRDRAVKLGEELLATGKYDELLLAQLRAGFERVIADAASASAQVLREAFFGRAGTCGGPGLVLRHMEGKS